MRMPLVPIWNGPKTCHEVLNDSVDVSSRWPNGAWKAASHSESKQHNAKQARSQTIDIMYMSSYHEAVVRGRLAYGWWDVTRGWRRAAAAVVGSSTVAGLGTGRCPCLVTPTKLVRALAIVSDAQCHPTTP
jgi:hypothetical protein